MGLPNERAGPRPGDVVGKYRVVAELGRGGMGIVHEAEDPQLERRVALKVLSPQLADDAEAVQRFVREARSAARLNHANIVTIHEVGDYEGTPYLVMELVKGGSAQALLDARGRLDWCEATRLAADTCRGLAAAHAAGLIHRDIKPANLMLAPDGTVKLGDFGLARAVDRAGLPLSTGKQVRGTPQFMSPEQCRAETLDARSDVYSLGATYFALLTGAPPYTEGSPITVMFAHCSRRVPDPRAACPDIPEACIAILFRALAKEPAERYPSALALLADLEAVQAGAPAFASDTHVLPRVAPRRVGRRVALAAGGAAILSLVGAAAYLVRAKNSEVPAPAPPGLPPFLEAGGPPAYRSLAFARDRDLLAWAVDDEAGTVVYWDLDANGHCRGSPFRAGRKKDFPSKFCTLSVSPDGQTVAHNRLDDYGFTTWTGGVRCDSTGLNNPLIRALTFGTRFGDDRRVALALHRDNENARGGNVVVWDCHESKQAARFVGPLPQANCVAFSPNGRLLAAGGDALVKVFDRTGKKEPSSFPTGARTIGSLSFSHHGRLLAAGGTQPSGKALVLVWDVDAGMLRPGPRVLLNGEALVAFSPMEPILAVCAGRYLLWDFSTRRDLATLDHLMRDEKGMRIEVRGMAFSGSGRILALSGSDNRIHLFDVDALLGRAR